MLFQGQVQANVPASRATGQPNSLQAQLGELGASMVLPRYAATCWSGQVFSVSLGTAANNSAFTGGAGGTPFLAVWNPAGTGKNVWPIAVSWANTATVTTTAATVAWALWYGPTAAITAAASTTFPISNLTMQATGSVAKAFVNTATTASTALTNMIPVGSYYNSISATAAGLVSGPPSELFGAVMIPPGSMMALGGSLTTTAGTFLAYLAWLELPV